MYLLFVIPLPFIMVVSLAISEAGEEFVESTTVLTVAVNLSSASVDDFVLRGRRRAAGVGGVLLTDDISNAFLALLFEVLRTFLSPFSKVLVFSMGELASKRFLLEYSDESDANDDDVDSEDVFVAIECTEAPSSSSNLLELFEKRQMQLIYWNKLCL